MKEACESSDNTKLSCVLYQGLEVGCVCTIVVNSIPVPAGMAGMPRTGP
jgi:hypothetical protein